MPVLLGACTLIDHEPRLGKSRMDTDPPVLQPGNGGVGTAAAADTSLYLSAIEYDPGYDWARDTASWTEPFRVLLFKGRDRMLSFPGGGDSPVRPDPDMHRIVDGHLYSDYSTPEGTVVLRDGEPFLEFDGRETISDLVFHNGKAHTIGRRRDGEGFSYRINGEAVIERKNACLFGKPFHTDGSTLCFSYWVPGRDDNPPEPWLVRNGEPQRLETDPSVSEIHDIRSVGGTVYILEKRIGSLLNPFLRSIPGGSFPLGSAEFGGDSVNFRILEDAGNGLRVYGEYRLEGETVKVLWKDECSIVRFGPCTKAVSQEHGLEGSLTVLDDGTISLYHGGKPGLNQPYGTYRLMDPDCFQMHGGRLWAALSGDSNILWRDGMITPFSFHGYFMGMEILP